MGWGVFDYPEPPDRWFIEHGGLYDEDEEETEEDEEDADL